MLFARSIIPLLWWCRRKDVHLGLENWETLFQISSSRSGQNLKFQECNNKYAIRWLSTANGCITKRVNLSLPHGMGRSSSGIRNQLSPAWNKVPETNLREKAQAALECKHVNPINFHPKNLMFGLFRCHKVVADQGRPRSLGLRARDRQQNSQRLFSHRHGLKLQAKERPLRLHEKSNKGVSKWKSRLNLARFKGPFSPGQ